VTENISSTQASTDYPEEPKGVRVAVFLTLSGAQYAAFTDEADLESSIVARLDEFYTAEGDPVTPHVLGIDVNAAEPGDEAAAHAALTARQGR
jgi:hypothetical protein